jgi:hypothetical protein
MSQAAMAGITANGHRWKHQIRLSAHTAAMGDMTYDTPEAEIEACRTKIVTAARSFAETARNLSDAAKSGILTAVEDLEAVDADLDEVRGAMSTLYDQFDYYRVVAV